mmetsp:Transcript_16882/g.51084  ORF Transcript_16882/g.51084 Transcript_16882/m.51084 type:complete len:117 (+) Transcript_16882:240-590(+)
MGISTAKSHSLRRGRTVAPHRERSRRTPLRARRPHAARVGLKSSTELDRLGVGAAQLWAGGVRSIRSTVHEIRAVAEMAEIIKWFISERAKQANKMSSARSGPRSTYCRHRVFSQA